MRNALPYLAILGLTFCSTLSGEGLVPAFNPRNPAAVMKPVKRVATTPPQPRFSVRDYGAKGDGTTFDTTAIQQAIDACAGSGGSVVIPAGKYVCAPLELKGRMTFYLEQGAVILGSVNPADYPVRMPEQAVALAIQRSLIYANKADDLVIDGLGTIDGRGKELPMMNGRPSLLRIYHSNRVTVRNVTFRNPRMWTCVYSECQDLLIDSTAIEAPPYCPNLDGMDICDSQNVVIRNNDIRSEDDSICLKSHGATGLKNILIENNTIVSYDANGIKIGTATVGPIENLRIVNNTVYGAKFGGLCIESVDGAHVRNVAVHGLDLYRVGQPIFVRLDARLSGPSESKDLGQKPASRAPGTLEGIVIERVRALGTHLNTKTSVSSITGIPVARINGLTLRDIAIQIPGGLGTVPRDTGDHSGGYPQSNLFGETPGSVFYVRHADHVTMERVQYQVDKSDARPWLAQVGAEVATRDCGPGDFGMPPACAPPFSGESSEKQ